MRSRHRGAAKAGPGNGTPGPTGAALGSAKESHGAAYAPDMAEYHLAQCNIGRILAPLDSEQLAGFVAALDPINALADVAPGFVWRLQTEEGNATSIHAFDD